MTKSNAKTALKLLVGTAAIEAAIKSITTRGKKLDHDIQIAAVSAMAHHAEHGDVTLVNRLVEGMPKGSRVNALRDFILAHGKVEYDEQLKAFKHDKNGSFDLEGACAAVWTDYKPEAPYTPFDAGKAITAMLGKLDNADPERGDKVTEAQAKAIRKMASELGLVK